MKALVIGYGSIGMRHARLLEGLGLDTAVVSRREIDTPKAFPTIAAGVADFVPDYAVVASRTQEHLNDVAALAETGFNGAVLVEKPLFDRLAALPVNTFAAVHVGYQLRFHPVVRRLKAFLSHATAFAVHAYVGQYLPDWRQGVDYRKGYSAIRAQGGGVLRDLSHELDFLTWILGGWSRLTALGGHFSNLEIDSDDVFSLLFETRRCPVVTVSLNYLDSTLRRRVLALTDKGSILADLAGGTVDIRGNTETFKTERDDAYIAVHKAVLAGDKDTLCTVSEGLAVVTMIAAAERAAAKREWAAA